MSRATSQSASRRKAPSSAAEMIGGVPPQNLDAERAVLGSILRDNFCLTEVARDLDADSFYSDKHQKVYQSIIEMFDGGKPIDVYTLGEHLALKGQLVEIGGAPTLVALFDETITAANVTHYARIVHEKAVLRSLIHASTEILRDAYAGTSDSEQLLAETETRIFRILEKRIGQSATEIRHVLTKAFDRISNRKKGEGALNGVPTPFYDLNELTDGWQNSELIILAARPSVGKTALALNLVEAAALHHKHPVLFASLEMSELELAERLLCSCARVNSHFLRKGRVDSEMSQRLIAVSNDLSEAPIFIDDTPGQTMLRIGATARRLKLRAGLKMVVVDYLQLIDPEDKSVNRNEQISVISRRLKNLARELQVPVIALSQLNRGVESREGHRPRMSDLRESGSIEQDADVVMLLHREDHYDKDKNPGVTEVIVAKNRNGPVGDVRLTFMKEYSRFESFSDVPVPYAETSEF